MNSQPVNTQGPKALTRIAHTLTRQKAVVAVLAMMILMLFVKSSFYTAYNWLNIFKEAAVMEIIAFGVTLTVICAGCDLSVGAVMSLSGILAVQMINAGLPILVAAAIAVLAGGVVGFVNGFLIVHQKSEAFIITLGMGMLVKGICQQLTDAHPVACKNLNFMMLGNGKIFGVIPNLSVVLLVLFVLAWCLLRFTSFGRNLYAIGGDYDVAAYSGINVVRTKWIAFILSGMIAAFSGVLLSARMNTGSSIFGDETALMVNCGVVVGGTSFAGGVGGIPQSFIGLFVLQLLLNVMNMMGVQPYWQLFYQGTVIVLIIWLDCFGRKRKREQV